MGWRRVFVTLERDGTAYVDATRVVAGAVGATAGERLTRLEMTSPLGSGPQHDGEDITARFRSGDILLRVDRGARSGVVLQALDTLAQNGFYRLYVSVVGSPAGCGPTRRTERCFPLFLPSKLLGGRPVRVVLEASRVRMIRDSNEVVASMGREAITQLRGVVGHDLGRVDILLEIDARVAWELAVELLDYLHGESLQSRVALWSADRDAPILARPIQSTTSRS